MMISDPKYIYIPIQKDKPDNDFGPIKIQSKLPDSDSSREIN